MSKHWEELLDKGPQIEEPDKRWKQKRGGKKPFAIEGKYIGPVNRYLESLMCMFREWHIARKYKTEKQRDQALANLVRKDKGRWEYRAYGKVEGPGALAK